MRTRKADNHPVRPLLGDRVRLPLDRRLLSSDSGPGHSDSDSNKGDGANTVVSPEYTASLEYAVPRRASLNAYGGTDWSRRHLPPAAATGHHRRREQASSAWIPPGPAASTQGWLA